MRRKQPCDYLRNEYPSRENSNGKDAEVAKLYIFKGQKKASVAG